MNKQLENYLSEAVRCETHAASAQDVRAAETFRKAAQVWRRLAMEWAALHRVTEDSH